MKKNLFLGLILSAAAMFVACSDDDNNSGPVDPGRSSSSSGRVTIEELNEAVKSGDLSEIGLTEECAQDEECTSEFVEGLLEDLGLTGLSFKCLQDEDCLEAWRDSVVSNMDFSFKGDAKYEMGCHWTTNTGKGDYACEEILWNSSDETTDRDSRESCTTILQAFSSSAYTKADVGPCPKSGILCSFVETDESDLREAHYGLTKDYCKILQQSGWDEE